MPHVTVHFDPAKVEQKLIDELKRRLQKIVAYSLSTEASRNPFGFIFGKIETLENEIYVRQASAHETDVNPAPIEVVVDAGKAKGRDADVVAALIDERVCGLDLIPAHLRGKDKSCIWVVFHRRNGFRFIEYSQ